MPERPTIIHRRECLRSAPTLVLTVLIVVCCNAATPVAAPSSDTPDLEEITARLTQAEQMKHSNLQEFSVVRHYVLKNSRLSNQVEMTVRWTYRKGIGKSFEILSSNTESGMSRRILERILEAEVESSRPNVKERGGITFENYSFKFLGTDFLEGRRCYLLALQPKHRSRFLIQGRAWIDAQDYAVAKVEGHLAANLSFWVGKPLITQQFQKYGNFWMASYNHSSSESLLLGKSDLTIDYDSYSLHSAEGPTVAQRVGVTH